MKLIVFGASRGVGRSLTELALADGHRVTAVVRNPSTVELNHESLEVVAGDVTDADSVRRCLPGHEVAFCAVGADKRGAKRCGSFRVEGLLTKVRVKVVRGNVPCRNAKRVMKRLFKGRNTRKWDCVGPQTGYAACTRGDSKITARF